MRGSCEAGVQRAGVLFGARGREGVRAVEGFRGREASKEVLGWLSPISWREGAVAVPILHVT